MSGKFTENNVANKFKALRPSTDIVNRNASTPPEDLVHAIRGLIHKTLNADIDSAYCLMALFAKEQVLLCDIILDRVRLLTRIGPEIHLEDVSPNPSHVGELLLLLDEMEGASADKLDYLAGQFATTVKSFAESSKTGTGVVTVGPDSAQLTEQADAAIDKIQEIAETLLAGISRFEASVSAFGVADLSSSTRAQQISKAKKVLTGYTNMSPTPGTVSEAILDSAMLSSLLNNSTGHKDITKPKFDGPVTIVPDKSAVLFGMTSPFIFHNIETATLAVNTGSEELSGDIVALHSAYPFMPIKPDFYEYSESGEIAAGDGTARFFPPELTAVENVYGAGLEKLTNKWLKTYVKPESVQVEALLFNQADPDNPLEYSFSFNEFGVASAVGFALPTVSYNPVPEEPTPSPGHVYTFADPLNTANFLPDYLAQIAASAVKTGKIKIYDANAALVDTLLEDIAGLVSDSDGLLYGSVHYANATVTLDLANHPAVATFAGGITFGFEDWNLIFFSTVDHLTGRLSLAFPLPVLDESAVKVSYTCYPIGMMEDRQHGEILPDGVFDTFTVLNTNTLVSVTVPTLASAHTDNPIKDALTLEWGLSAVLPAALMGSSVTGDLETVLVAAPIAGTASRITFPNYVPAAFNYGAFGPTWTNRPKFLNQVIAALHHLSGDVFGGHSYVKDIIKQPPLDAEGLLDLGVLVKSIATGITATPGPSWWPDTDFKIPTHIPVQAGDKAEIFSPGVYYVDIAAVLPVGEDPTSQAIRLAQPVPRALSNPGFGGTAALAADGVTPLGEVLADLPTLKLNITRNKLRVVGSNDPGSKLAATELGFGLTGSTDAESSAFYLGAQFPLSKTPTDRGYIIKPNDVIFQNDRRIARIVGVSGDSTNANEDVSVSFAPLPSANISFPISDFKIVAQGYSKFLEVLPALSRVRQDLSVLVSDGELPKKAKAFFGSGAGYSQYGERLYSLQTEVQNLRNLYAGYDAHIVKSVGGLLEYLKGEKLTTVHNMLLGLQFSRLNSIGPSTLGQEVSMESLMEEAMRMFGGSADFVQVLPVTKTLLDDYYERGEDPLENALDALDTYAKQV